VTLSGKSPRDNERRRRWLLDRDRQLRVINDQSVIDQQSNAEQWILAFVRDHLDGAVFAEPIQDTCERLQRHRIAIGQPCLDARCLLQLIRIVQRHNVGIVPTNLDGQSHLFFRPSKATATWSGCNDKKDLRFCHAQSFWKECCEFISSQAVHLSSFQEPFTVTPYQKRLTPITQRMAGDIGHYLVDAIALRRSFRDHFLCGLNRLRERDELKLEGDFVALKADDAWKSLNQDLQSTEWVSHIEPPPHKDCPAEHVLKYLAHYLTGGPISDSRIVSADPQEVAFLARASTTQGGDSQQIPMTLPTVEFIRRSLAACTTQRLHQDTPIR